MATELQSFSTNMTASGGIAIGSGAATLPIGFGAAAADSKQAAPSRQPASDDPNGPPQSFQSALENCSGHDRPAPVSRDSSPRKSAKDDSGSSRKSDKKSDAHDDSSSTPQTAVTTSAPPPRVLPLTFALLNLTSPAAIQPDAIQPDTTPPDTTQLDTTQSTGAAAEAADAQPADSKTTASDASAATDSAALLAQSLPETQDLSQPQQAPNPAIDDAPPALSSSPRELAFAAKLSPGALPQGAAQTQLTRPAINAPKASSNEATNQTPDQRAGAASDEKTTSQISAPQRYFAGGSMGEEGELPDQKQAPKPEPAQDFKTLSQALSQPSSNQPAPAARNNSPSSDQPAVQALHEPAIEPAPAPQASSHDIHVRIPDNQGGAMDVRFLENAGEVRVTVRTQDNNLAQSLRGDLNQLVQQLSNGGIQTELWQPGSDRSFSHSQQESQNFGQASDGRGGQQSGQQQEPNQNKPRWLEEMERSGVYASS